MEDKKFEVDAGVEKEIIECFIGFIPPDTLPQLTEAAAKMMGTAAIDKAVEMGRELNLTPEEAINRLLISLRYGHEMPERGETIH